MDDSKESASSKPEGTPTGRIKSDSLIDFIDRWMGPTPTYLREAMGALENSPEIPVISGMDFGRLEARTVAMLMSNRNGVLHVERILEGDMFRGQKADLCILDEIAPMIGEDLFEQLFGSDDKLHEYKLVKDWSEPIPDLRLPDKKTKQNGRDASYLDLDPTKRHGKRRR